jgi:PHD/YefM family antitoxin component YafN of YafNO toxin-antitoxin module
MQNLHWSEVAFRISELRARFAWAVDAVRADGKRVLIARRGVYQGALVPLSDLSALGENPSSPGEHTDVLPAADARAHLPLLIDVARCGLRRSIVSRRGVPEAVIIGWRDLLALRGADVPAFAPAGIDSPRRRAHAA